MSAMLVDTKRRHQKGTPKLLIGSLCRCGTWYTTYVLREIGISTSHEFYKHFKLERLPKYPEQPNTIEISGWSTPILKHLKPNSFMRTAYQIRDPLEVVKSTIWPYWDEGKNRGRPTQILETYLQSYKWWSGVELKRPRTESEFIQVTSRIVMDTFLYGLRTTEYGYRVEDFEMEVWSILEMIGKVPPVDTPVIEALSKISRNTNSRKRKKTPDMWHQQLTWADLPSDIVDFAKELGYAQEIS